MQISSPTVSGVGRVGTSVGVRSYAAVS